MCVPQKLASDTADKDTSPGRYNYSVHTTQRHTAKAVSTSAALINWARPMRCVQPRCFWHTTAAVTTIEISRLSVSTGWTFWHAWHHVILSTPVGVLQNVTCMYTVVSFTCINVKKLLFYRPNNVFMCKAHSKVTHTTAKVFSSPQVPWI